MSNPVCKTLKKLSSFEKFHNVSLHIKKDGTPHFTGSNNGLNVWYQCKQTPNGPRCIQIRDTDGYVDFKPSADFVKNGLVLTALNTKGVVHLDCE